MKVLFWLLVYFFVGLDEALYRRTRIPCPSVLLHNGRVRFRQKSGFAQYQCFKGYLLAGEKYSRCVNGHWDSPRPKCVRASCQKIKPPANGLIHASHRGAVLNFFCRPGYELNGPNMTSCDGRVWDSYLPTCLLTNRIPTLTCNFETDDLCGWSHDLNHNFDWTRMNFKTPSGHVGTGPAFDHTKGENGNGYYMYIESSTRNINDTARLISPVYERQDNDTCLEFYYHMYGFATGQLRVYLKKISEPWVFQLQNSVFWKSGNHGNQWLKSVLHLGAIEEDFQIIFEGVRGTSYSSDIAIDDVKIIENCIVEEDFTTTTESESYTDTITYGSCLNRCATSSKMTVSPDGLSISCDCDDACVDRNSCCPDYINICILNDFSTDYTDYFASTTETVWNDNMTTAADVMTAVISVRNRTVITTPTTSTTTQPTTTRATPTTTRGTPTTIRGTPTTTRATPTTQTSTPTRVISKKIPTIKKRIPTKIINKTITIKTTPKVTTTKLTSTTTKPTTIRTKPTKKFELINDIATLPTVTEEVSVPLVMVTTKAYEYTQGINKEKAATIKEKPKNSDSGSVTIAIISVSSVILVVIVAFLVRKYRRNSCLRIKKMKSGTGDSQSDVRFLTSDEVLDFNLPCDYDML